MVDSSQHPAPGSHPAPATIGQLRASGYRARTVKAEIRDNLVRTLSSGENAFPGIVGFDDTVLPDVQRALLAGHDFVLLGERGQGKTRLMRTIVGLLDEWSPEISGCEIHDEPLAPICSRCRTLVVTEGDDVPIDWRHREDRYTEKLATPDTSVGDLIGDVDPTKVAEGRTLGDPETIHYGLLPRGHRGVFALNELPDLAERIQVALFNVLEERDIQVRGYAVRLPLDMLVVASANPEDYTNRGRIITPLKDRFGAEVRTHYLDDVEQEIALIQQEAELVATVPIHILEVIARLVQELRTSSSVDQRSGVSARFAIAAAESTAASALRRAALTGEDEAVARIGDLGDVLPSLRGKVEFEMGEEGRELEVVGHLLRLATAATFRERVAGGDLTGFTAHFEDGSTVETGDLVPAATVLAQIGATPGLAMILERLGIDEESVSPGQVAAAVEFVLEGLHLTRRLSKVEADGQTIYGS